MVRVKKKRNGLNERSLSSMHYDSPVTRSQTAVLDLFKSYSNKSNMFSDPEVRSILEEELTKNPGRVMTRHMVTYRPISEIENLAKLANERKCRDREQPGISPVVKCSRVRTRKLRMRKCLSSARNRRRRSRSSVLSRNRFPKRRRKGIDHIRITINDITKQSMKQPNAAEIQTQAGQEKDARLAYESKSINDCREIYLGGAVDGLQNEVGVFVKGKEEEFEKSRMKENNIPPTTGIIFGRGQDQFYPSRNPENNISRKEIRFGTVYHGFDPSQSNKDRTHMMNNIMLDPNLGVYAPRTLENGTPLWNDTRFGKQTNILTSGMDAQQDVRNRGFKTTSAQETMKTLMKSDETGIHCQKVYDSSNHKSREMKVVNDFEKHKNVSLWFGNAVSSVSSYVTKYMPFRY